METLRFLLATTHFPPFKMGGDAIFVGYLAEELASRGHEVHVAYDSSVFRILRGEPDQRIINEDDLPVVRHDFHPRYSKLSLLLNLGIGTDFRSKGWMNSLIRRTRPDVVHWHNTKGFLAQPWHVQSANTLYTAHDYYSICPRSNLLRPGERICEEPRLCQLCLMRWRKPPQIWRIGSRVVMDLPEALKVLAPSEFMATRLRRDGVNVHSVLRIFMRDPQSRGGMRREREDLLLFIGILENRKGPQTLLRAFIDSSRDHGFRLVIVGEGPLRSSLNEMVIRNGLEDRVSLPGFIPRAHVEELLSSACLMVVPSEWSENAPMTTLEAFSNSVPVIGTRMGGLPEILAEDTGSILFDARDVAQLAMILTSLWGDRQSLKRRGKMARDAYLKRYSPEAHLSAYLKLALS